MLDSRSDQRSDAVFSFSDSLHVLDNASTLLASSDCHVSDVAETMPAATDCEIIADTWQSSLAPRVKPLASGRSQNRASDRASQVQVPTCDDKVHGCWADCKRHGGAA